MPGAAFHAACGHGRRGGSFTNVKDVNGLVGKLGDYQSALNALATAAKAKVDPAVAQSLSNEAQGVITCIESIGKV